MTEALERAAERLRQLRAAQAERAVGVVAARQAGAGAGAGAPPIGALVFDTVSGAEGVIVGRSTQNVVVSAAAE